MFDIQEQLKLLPDEPGVYLMKNKNNKIIYIILLKISFLYKHSNKTFINDILKEYIPDNLNDLEKNLDIEYDDIKTI